MSSGSYPAHQIDFAPGIASSAVPAPGDWIEITSKVHEWGTKWGTEDEFTQPSAGSADLTLDNSAGLFDPDNTTGTYYGNLLPGTWFRIRAGTTTANTDVFYGQVDQDGFQVGASQYPDSIVRVTLLDVSEFLANVEIPGSVYESEVLADAPLLWWRLGESSGATAADSSGNNRNGSYTGSPTGTSGLVPYDSNSAIQFDGADDKAEFSAVTLGANFAIEMWVRADADTGTVRFPLQIGGPYAGIQLKSDIVGGGTKLIYRYEDPSTTPYAEYTSTAEVFDNEPHHVVITQSGATTNLYVDGVEGKTLTTGAAGSTTWGPLPVKLGAGELGFDPTTYFAGTIDEFALYSTALSAARVTAHYNAGTAPWDGDVTSTRFGRILDAIGYDATQRNINTGQSTMQPAEMSGDAWSALLDIARTENGAVYIDHQDGGKVRFLDRHHRWTATASVTSQATIGDGGGAEIPAAAIDLVDDRIINHATIQRAGGDPVTSQDTASQTIYRKRTLNETGLLYQDDSESLERGERIVAEKKDRHRRIRSITLKPRKSTHPAWAHVFARKMNDRVTGKWRPTYGGTRTYDSWIIGIKQRWTRNDGLETVFFLAPVPFDTTAEPYWIAGISTAGVTTRPGY